MCYFYTSSNVIVFKLLFFILLRFSIANSENEGILSSDNVLLCSENDTYSCKCVYYTDQVTDIPAVDINCSNMNITVFEGNIAIPKIVYTLDMSENSITVISANNPVTSLTLTTLLLSKNQISKIEENALGHLPNLIDLDLSENLLHQITPRMFNGIGKLKVLNLAYNNIETLEKCIFETLPELRGLNLNGNKLNNFFSNVSDAFDTTGFCISQKLTTLRLDNNNITGFNKDFFKSAHGLRKIILSRNNITHVPRLPAWIEHLDLSSTGFSTIKQADLSYYPAITELILNDLTELSEIEDRAFELMKNLQVLRIENCKRLRQLDPLVFGIEEVDGYKNYDFTIRKISLLGSGFSTMNERLYPLFSHLASLDLRGNPWRCDCRISWLTRLNVPDEDKEFISCQSPQSMYGRKLWSLKDVHMVCHKNANVLHWIATNSLIVLCFIMGSLVVWLFIVWPKTKKTRIVNPTEQPYTVISLEPNNAENIN